MTADDAAQARSSVLALTKVSELEIHEVVLSPHARPASLSGVPMVRIHLPPGESQMRTSLVNPSFMTPARWAPSQTRMVDASIPAVSEPAALGYPLRECADHSQYEPLREHYRANAQFRVASSKNL